MAKISVVGGGQIGRVVADQLAATGHEAVLADRRPLGSADGIAGRVRTVTIDATDGDAMGRLLADQDIVVSACPYFLNEALARSARAAGVHYLDLTEDVRTSKAIRRIAEGADTAFIPQCGLAPGFIGILAGEMIRGFEHVHSIQMRVGALPLYPTNALKYNLTWSTDGLINEYCNPCDAIADGKAVTVLPLEGLEQFALDGVDYEAFNTSGGLGSLCETLAGKVDNLNYKTIRYPGHRDAMKLLLHDLGLAEDRDTLRRILEKTIPQTNQDVVIAMVSAVGMRGGRLHQKSHVTKVYGDGEHSAIQLTTSAGVCGVIELLLSGKLPQRGFVPQEQVSLQDFLATRAGAIYRGAAREPSRAGAERVIA